MITLTDKMYSLKKRFRREPGNDSLQYCDALLTAMTILSEASTIKMATPLLYLSVKISSHDLDNTNKTAPLAGSSINAIIDDTCTAVLNILEPKATKGQRLLLSMLSKVTVLTTVGYSSIKAASGIGLFPLPNEVENMIARLFSVKLMMSMTSKAEVIFHNYRAIAKQCGFSEKTTETLAWTLGLINTLLVITAIAKEGEIDDTSLVEAIMEPLTKAVTKVKEFVNDLKNIAAAAPLTALLHEASIALDKEDLDNVMKAALSALEQCGIAKEKIISDIKEIKSLALMLQDSLTTGVKEQTDISTKIISAG